MRRESRNPIVRQTSRRVRGVVVVALFLTAQTVAAQGGSRPPVRPPTSPPPKAGPKTTDTVTKAATAPVPALAAPSIALASLSGTIYDSVHAAPLRQAAVMIEGSARLGLTSDEGRYRIDSIPPGTHRIRVEHALLDSVGVTFVTDTFRLADNESKIVDLSVPSSQTLVAVSCPAARRALGPSAIIGRLLDADTDVPVAGARVSFAWMELSLTAGLRRVPRVRDAITDSTGVFRVCGLPNQVEGTLQADKQGITTSEVKLSFEGQPLMVQGLRIGNAQTVARAATDSGTPVRDSTAGRRFSAVNIQRGQAVLTGRVVSASGQPMGNVRVEVQGTKSTALSRDNGEFTLTELPSGTQTVTARQIGFAPVYQPVELSTRAPARTTIMLSKPANVQTLSPVVVTAQANAGLDRVGFNERKKSGFGTYITGDEVMKRGPNTLTDVFRTVPQLRVRPGGYLGTEYVVEDARSPGIGGSCVRYVIDNGPYEAIYPGDIDRMIPPWEVGAIEIYHGSQTPVQFSTAGQSGCAVIVIWSKNQLENAARRKR